MVALATLAFPVILTTVFGMVSLLIKSDRKSFWANYRKFETFILLATTAAWWIQWDLADGSSPRSMGWLIETDTRSLNSWHFWLPPTISLFLFLFLSYEVGRVVRKLRWTTFNSVLRAWWKVVSFVTPLLMVAAGLELLLNKKLLGVLWLVVAGPVSRIGTALLRRTEGWKLHALKTGETRTRALRIARGMDTSLRRVFVVPAGKGHLTNAYGMASAIGVTDNLGQYLNESQLESVVAHEVAHVKLKHARRNLMLVVSIYLAVGLMFFFAPRSSFRPALQLLAIFGPLLVEYYCSRGFEFAADREAVEFTNAPEVAIEALTKLHQIRELPAAYDGFAELFATHPTLAHRVRAIAKRAHMSRDQLASLVDHR